jgi:hypothetical protein
MNRTNRSVFLGLALAAIAGTVSYLGYLRSPSPAVQSPATASAVPAATPPALLAAPATQGPVEPQGPITERLAAPSPDPVTPPLVEEAKQSRRRPCCSTSRWLNGFLLPVMHDPRDYRLKIVLNADPRLPWGAPYPPEAVQGFGNSIGVTGGTFPVHIWRNRLGAWKRIVTIRVPATSNGLVQYQLPDALIEKGDTLVIENNTGFIRDRDPRTGAYIYPAGNLVDNRSNDPQLLPTAEFPLTEIRYTN